MKPSGAKQRTPSSCKGRPGTGQPGCGAALLWPINPKTGKGMPVDAVPRQDGNIAIEEGIAVVMSPQRALAYQGARYISHFATCPYADRFRPNKPNRAPTRPSDIPLGAFDSPAAAAIGRIESGALDLTVDRLVAAFCSSARDLIGPHPTPDELQHLWKVWQRKQRDCGVSVDTLALVAKRAKARLVTAEDTAA